MVHHRIQQHPRPERVRSVLLLIPPLIQSHSYLLQYLCELTALWSDRTIGETLRIWARGRNAHDLALRRRLLRRANHVGAIVRTVRAKARLPPHILCLHVLSGWRRPRSQHWSAAYLSLPRRRLCRLSASEQWVSIHPYLPVIEPYCS